MKQKYIPSYISNQRMQQYGFGSWLKGNAGAIGTIAGGAVGMLGGPAGMALGASIGGSLGGGIQSNYQAGEAADQQQQNALAQNSLMQKQQSQMAKDQSMNNLRQSRMSEYTAQQGGNQNQYASMFAANGGFMNQYGDGGRLKASYNQKFPQVTASGDTIYITPTTTKTMADTANFKPFNDIYSYYRNDSLVPDFGNVQPFGIYGDNKVAFKSDSKGSTDSFKDLFLGKYDPKKANGGYIPSHKSGGKMKYAGGGYMEETRDNPDVTYFSNGGTHEQSPTNGIPIGNKGLVEQGEVKAKINGGEYVFSDRF